jgi:hypothetical protein
MERNEIGSALAFDVCDCIIVSGTDATMAEHIKKIQERNFVVMTPERTFTPTNLGLSLVDGLIPCPISILERPLVQGTTQCSSTSPFPSHTCAANWRPT